MCSHSGNALYMLHARSHVIVEYPSDGEAGGGEGSAGARECPTTSLPRKLVECAALAVAPLLPCFLVSAQYHIQVVVAGVVVTKARVWT